MFNENMFFLKKKVNFFPPLTKSWFFNDGVKLNVYSRASNDKIKFISFSSLFSDAYNIVEDDVNAGGFVWPVDVVLR